MEQEQKQEAISSDDGFSMDNMDMSFGTDSFNLNTNCEI